MAWLRLYDTLPDDPKIQMLSDRAFRTLINLWCIAKRRGGSLPADLATLAFALRMSEGKVRDTLQALISAKLIDKTEAGYEPHDWNEHQYDSDSASERMRRYRERNKKHKESEQVTASLRPPLRNSDVPDSETEAEAETEKKKVEDRAPQAGARPSKPKRRLRTPLPEDCPTSQGQGDAMQFWGVHARFDLADGLTDQIAQFRDHHLKLGSTMADWDAAWRTWFRNALKFNRQEKANGSGRERPPSRVDNAISGASRFLETAGGSAEGIAGGSASGRAVVARAVHGPTSEADDHPRANGASAPGPGRDLSLADAFTRTNDDEIPHFLRRSAEPVRG